VCRVSRRLFFRGVDDAADEEGEEGNGKAAEETANPEAGNDHWRGVANVEGRQSEQRANVVRKT
jgi:hypothetical protein